MRWSIRASGSIVAPALSVSLLVLASPLFAQLSDIASEEDKAVQSLLATREVEARLLEEELARYPFVSLMRRESLARLTQIQEGIEAEVDRREAADPDRLRQLMDQVTEAEADLAARSATEQAVLERIRDRLRHVALLGEQIDQLRGEREEEETGMLTGTWDLMMMPVEQRGRCVLRQSGAVVQGTYQLDGGFSGSLQGTLVNRKVYLERIDSKLGKVMELEGFLSGDGKQIRGTWLNLELAGAEGSTGHWTAKRAAKP